MSLKPILFSTEMVNAILEGRKTQTRRVIQPQPEQAEISGRWYWQPSKSNNIVYCDASRAWYEYCTYLHRYHAGDLLWVRETWQAQNTNKQWWHEVPNEERELHNWVFIDKATHDCDLPTPPKWIPSIFMPRWASRITLEVTGVRVERVQDITEAEAYSEGCVGHTVYSLMAGEQYVMEPDYDVTPVDEFQLLWDSINAKRGYSWESNPWVWVVEFENRIDGN